MDGVKWLTLVMSQYSTETDVSVRMRMQVTARLVLIQRAMSSGPASLQNESMWHIWELSLTVHWLVFASASTVHERWSREGPQSQ